MKCMSESMQSRSTVAESGHTRNLTWPDAPTPLPSLVIDNHAHFDCSDGEGEVTVADHLRWAEASGIAGVITVGCDLSSARWTHTLLDGKGVADTDREYVDERLRGAVAIHPNDSINHLNGVGRHGEELPSLDDAIAELSDLLDHERMVAVGETGLDWFRTSKKKPAHREAQIQSFRMHIALAKEKNLPMQIHDRDAHADVLQVLDAEGTPEPTVFHCFSGDAEFARAVLDRGCYLSFAGTVTFKNAQNLRDALEITPLNRVMVETDAPFLTPEPWRGRPNSSYLIPHTMQTIADVKGVSLKEACVAVRATEREVYGWAGA